MVSPGWRCPQDAGDLRMAVVSPAQWCPQDSGVPRTAVSPGRCCPRAVPGRTSCAGPGLSVLLTQPRPRGFPAEGDEGGHGDSRAGGASFPRLPRDPWHGQGLGAGSVAPPEPCLSPAHSGQGGPGPSGCPHGGSEGVLGPVEEGSGAETAEALPGRPPSPRGAVGARSRALFGGRLQTAPVTGPARGSALVGEAPTEG